MPIIKINSKKAAQTAKRFDWTRVDGLSDRTLAKQIRTHSDAAPDMTAALKRGAVKRPIKPDQIRAVRRKTGLSQTRFAAHLQLNVATIRNWEQGRTRPDGAAIALLTIIDRAPDVAMQVLEH